MNTKQSVIFHLAYLNKIINHRANVLLRESGYQIRIEQLPVIMTLHYQGRLSQQELANLLFRDKSSIQRTIVTLTRAQLVTINDDNLDKRKNIVALSGCGKLLAARLEKNIDEIESHLLQHIGSKAIEKLINIIDDLDLKPPGSNINFEIRQSES